MNNSDPSSVADHARNSKRKLSRDTVFLIGDLLPLCDFTSVLLAAGLTSLVYTHWFSSTFTLSDMWSNGGRAALAAAVLAPLILCDRAFVGFASGGQTAALVRCYVVRFLMFGGVVAAVGLASRFLDGLPQAWLALWITSCLLVTATTRLLLVGNLRRLERKGVLTEAVAIVGAGAAADQLIRHLQKSRPNSVEILGIFDDRHGRRECGERQDAGAADRQGWRECDGQDGALQAADERLGAGAADHVNLRDACLNPATGSIEDLIELGQSCSMDWILLTLPSSAEDRLQSIVHRLKPLAVPIGLCPQNIGLAGSRQIAHYVGKGLPVTLLVDRHGKGWDAAALEIVLPRWIITLLSLPFVALKFLFAARHEHAMSQPSKLACPLDNYDLKSFTKVAARFGQNRFGYVVTPNADHLIRLHREPSFRALYADAAYILLDSRFISQLLRFTRRLRLPVCTGSDLTAKLFNDVIAPDDRLVLIGGSNQQAARLSERYGLQQLVHFNPPMGFIRNPIEVEDCLQFVEAHSPFRYCLLAVGAPQQEAIAQRLKARGVARGMALCIGASINFLTGEERRAPLWMQCCGMEWLYRLLQAPGRMAQRYLVRGPQLFGLLRRTDIVLRAAPELRPLSGSARTAAIKLVRG